MSDIRPVHAPPLPPGWEVGWWSDRYGHFVNSERRPGYWYDRGARSASGLVVLSLLDGKWRVRVHRAECPLQDYGCDCMPA